MNFIKKYYLFFISLALFIIPFFWLKDNQVNLGGDSSRLYFYDPFHFITNYVLYGINPWNLGGEMVGYFMIPFSLFLQLFLLILKTPHNLINFFNAFSLLIAFLGTYGSIAVILSDALQGKHNKQITKLVGVIGGFFYIFAPTMTNWDRAIITFNQIFLDPAIFFLLYKYFQTKRSFYIIIVLFITFLFASNFSFIGAPTFFSFYPFVFIFFLVRFIFFKREKISLRKNLLFLTLFIGIQAFHLFPQIYMLINPTTNAYQRVFVGQIFDYVNYFKQVALGISVQNNFLGLPQYDLPFAALFFIFPFICFAAFFGKIKTQEEKKLRQLQVVLSLIFVGLLFFISAKITNLGLEFYANLFRLPGFGMFRNFHGQFVTSFFFFYALFIGVSLYSLFTWLSGKKRVVITVFVLFVLFIRGWPLLNGSMLYIPILQATNNTTAPFVISDSLKQSLSYISSLPGESKILTLPLTDFGYQMVAGKSSGLYMGPSFVGPLTTKKDFTGYDAMDVFGNTFLSSVKSKNFEVVKNILAVLNIHNIFWDKNNVLYGANFPNFPYQTTEEYIPTTKEAYKNFIDQLPIVFTKQFPPDIQFSTLSPTIQLPFIFPSTQVIYTNLPFDTPYLLEGKALNTTILPEANYTGFVPSTSFEAEPTNAFVGLDNNFQFHKAVPEVSWKPGSLAYSLILWKENRSVLGSQGLTKFTYAYLYLAKRLEEMNKWEYSLAILHTNSILQEPKLWEFNKWGSYDSWEMVVSHYYHQAQSLIAYIKQEPQQDMLSDKIIASEQFEQHRYRLLSIINTSSLSPQDKKYLSVFVNNVFRLLLSNLAINILNTDSKQYSVHVPVGDYKVHVLNANYIQNLSVDVVSKEKIFLKTLDSSDLSSDFTLPQDEDLVLTLQYTPQNLAEASEWENSGSIDTTGSESLLTVQNAYQNSDSGVTRKITTVPGVNQYAISFKYNTNNKKFIAKLSERRKDDSGTIVNFDDSFHVLQSTDWEVYQTVLTIDPKTVSTFLQITNDEYEGKQQISVKDFSIVPLVTPIVELEKQQVVPSPLPRITFQRINPAKYKVIIENASNPFVLTMLDQYSTNWKMYGPYPVNPIKKTSLSYLNGAVSEGENKNNLIDQDTLKTLFARPLAEVTHFAGDGYANSWIITPADVQNKKTYELIIELQSQKLFYVGSLVTILTIVIILVIGIFSFGSIFKNSTLQRKR